MPDSDNGNSMHREVEWMVPADTSILELLHAARDQRGRHLIWTPNTIGLNTGYSRKHTANRCLVLTEHGLLERLDRGRYRLSDLGERVLDGEIEPSELSTG